MPTSGNPPRAFALLRKLRGRSPAELRLRAAQALAALKERRGWSPDVGEPTDRAFAKRLVGGKVDATAIRLAFAERKPGQLLDAWRDIEATATAVRERWPDAGAKLIDRADRAMVGHFDLLGHADLDFGRPIDWHLDPIAGVRAPRAHWSQINYLEPGVAGDHKVVWELNRHQHLVTLAQAYHLTGDQRFVGAIARQLDAWMDANPPKNGINWASSLELAFRGIAWTWALHLVRGQRELPPETFLRALKFLDLSARHLETYLSTYFAPNTHLTGEALGLFYIGSCFPELAAAPRWRQLGWDTFATEMERQVLPDGVYYEQSTAYQRYVADFLLHAILVGTATGWAPTPRLRPTAEKVLDFLLAVSGPDGTAPLIGDDDGGRLLPLNVWPANDFRDTLAVAGRILGRPDYCSLLPGSSPAEFWTLGRRRMEAELAAESAVKAPAMGSRAFPRGGVYVMRDGWSADANFAVIDAGPHGPVRSGSVHSHADALAIVVTANGEPMLVDPGTYTYTGSAEWRDYFRHSASHNTLTVDGESSSVSGGPFRWSEVAHPEAERWCATAVFDYFVGRSAAYRRLPSPVEHERAVLFVKRWGWVIRDRVTATGPHSLTTHFHCAPGVEVELRSPHEARLKGRSGNALDLTVIGGTGKFSIEMGWVSPVYGVKVPAPIVRYELDAPGSAEITTVLTIGRADEMPIVCEQPAAGGRALRIARLDAAVTVLLSDGAMASTIDLEADGPIAWAERNMTDGTSRAAGLTGGKWIKVPGLPRVELNGQECWAAAVRGAEGWAIQRGVNFLEGNR